MNKGKKQKDLLIEVGEFDGVFDKFDAVLAPWKDFAGLLGGNVQKLVKQTVFPLKMIFTPLKKNVSFSKMWTEHTNEIDKIKGDISKYEEALGEKGGSGAKALAIFNPGAALAVAAGKGSFDFLMDPSSSAAGKGLRSLGIHYLPFMGWLEDKNEGGEKDFASWLESQRDGSSSSDGEGKGPFSGLFSKIQGVFLLDFSHYERPGMVIREAAENDKVNKALKDLIDLMSKKGVFEEMRKVAKEINDEKEKFLEEFIVEAEAVMGVSVDSIKSETIEDFGKVIKKYEKDFSDLKKIDIKKIDTELEKSVDELVTDEEKAAKFLETLEREGTEIETDDQGKPLEEDFRAKAKSVFYNQVKVEILKELKTSIENTYDQLQKTILGTEGLNDENIRKQMEKTEEGKRHIEIVTKNLEKIKSIVAKIETN